MAMVNAGTHSFGDRKKSGMLRLRVLLGIFQMAGVICTITLLIQTGINPISLGSAIVTCSLTSVSVLVFGSHRDKRR
jgi:hypothetical protein